MAAGGRGAWPFFYKPGDDFRSDPQGRNAHGLKAIKRELIYNGYVGAIKAELPTYGNAMAVQVKKFQKDNGLLPDGHIGPRTALVLFRKRSDQFEKVHGVKNHWLCKIKTNESGNDPVAEGYLDRDDEGILQFNLHYNPTVTQEQAWNPAWSLNEGAAKLKAYIVYCGDEEGGVAAWNVGRIVAKRWVEAGKPSSGGPVIGSQDYYTRAAKYVERVKHADF